MTTRINYLGEPIVRRDSRRHGLPEWYARDERSNVSYLCFDSSPRRVIWRATTTGGVTVREFGYGAWADRETLEYVPLDRALEVEA